VHVYRAAAPLGQLALQRLHGSRPLVAQLHALVAVHVTQPARLQQAGPVTLLALAVGPDRGLAGRLRFLAGLLLLLGRLLRSSGSLLLNRRLRFLLRGVRFRGGSLGLRGGGGSDSVRHGGTPSKCCPRAGLLVAAPAHLLRRYPTAGSGSLAGAARASWDKDIPRSGEKSNQPTHFVSEVISGS